MCVASKTYAERGHIKNHCVLRNAHEYVVWDAAEQVHVRLCTINLKNFGSKDFHFLCF